MRRAVEVSSYEGEGGREGEDSGVRAGEGDTPMGDYGPLDSVAGLARRE